MIDSLSASMGLLAGDPLFWMPLVLSMLVCLLLIGLVLLDGFELGAGLILPWISAENRARVLDALAPWRGANESWLLLALAFSMAAFPLAWSLLTSRLYAAIVLLVSGAVVRYLAYEFRARASMNQQSGWLRLFMVGSLLGAVGYGLLLVGFVTGLRFQWDLLAFGVLVVVAVLAWFVLLGALWTLLWSGGELRRQVAKLALGATRWCAAGMVAVSFMLALVNPAIFYRWTHGDNLMLAAFWWLVMLAVYVALDIRLRSFRTGDGYGTARLPFVLAGLLLVLMLAGLVYSIFPFLILDSLTVWDAASSLSSLGLVMASALVALPVLLIFNVLGYWRLFVRRTISPVSPSAVQE